VSSSTNGVVRNYDFCKEIKSSKHELLGIEGQVLTPGIMDLNKMARFKAGEKMFLLKQIENNGRFFDSN